MEGENLFASILCWDLKVGEGKNPDCLDEFDSTERITQKELSCRSHRRKGQKI